MAREKRRQPVLPHQRRGSGGGKEFLHYDNEWKPIATKVPGLASEYFLVTGSGKYFRNVIIDPEDSICIIELDEKERITASFGAW